CMTESEARASFPRRILFGSAPTIAGPSECLPDDQYLRQSPCLPDDPYRRQSLPRDPSCHVNIRHVSSRSSQLPRAFVLSNSKFLGGRPRVFPHDLKLQALTLGKRPPPQGSCGGAEFPR